MDGLIASRTAPYVPPQSAAPVGKSPVLSPERLVAGLRRASVPIAACALAGALLAYLYASSLPKSYTASAAVAVEGDRIGIPELQGALRADNAPDPMPLVHTEVQALSSRQLIQQVSDALHLDRNSEFNAALRPPTLMGKLKGDMMSWLPASKSSASPSAVNDGLVNAVTHALVISQDNRSLVIGLAFTAHDPALAARFVNTLVATYIDGRAQRRVSANSGANAVMSQRVEQTRADIDRIEQQMRTLRNTSGMVGLRAGSVGQQQVEDLATAASRATLDRSEIEANWQRASALASGGSSDALASVLGSETISRLREQEAQASAHVADLSQRYGPAYPALRSAQADLSATRSQLSGETHRIVTSLATQLRVARAHEADVLAQLASARHAGVDAQNTQAELDQLQQDATTRRQLYRTLLERAQQTSTQPQGTETPDVRVLSDAVPPGLPSAPKMKEAAVFGGLGGALLAWGISLAFLTQSSPLDGEGLARTAGISVGARLRKQSSGRDLASKLVQTASGSEADSMRQLRAYIGQMSRIAPRVVAFVSAQPGDLAAGAACAFARAAAQDGRRVLLVDAGAENGDMPRLLRASGGKLSDVLSGEIDLQDAVLPDTVGGLDLLLHGAKNPVPAGLDAGRNAIGFENLLIEAKQDYDLIVLGAPYSARADATSAVRSSDASVLVIDERHAGDKGALAAASALRSGTRVPLAALLIAG